MKTNQSRRKFIAATVLASVATPAAFAAGRTCHCCPAPLPEISEALFQQNRRSFLGGAEVAGSPLGGLSFDSIFTGVASQQILMSAVESKKVRLLDLDEMSC